MKFYILFTFLVTSLGQTFAYDKQAFRKLAIENNIPTSRDGLCQKTRKEVIQALYDMPSEITPYEGTKEHIDCLSLLKNFKHDKKSQDSIPSWTEILNAKDVGKKEIKGKIKYMGLIPQKYHYDIKRNSDDGFDIEVRIFVKKWKLWKKSLLMEYSLSERVKHQERIFDRLLEEVSRIWSHNEHNLRFRFKRVSKKKNAQFAINVVQSLAPLKYNSKWTWFVTDDVDISDEKLLDSFEFQSSVETYAHEVGHMLGLEDEYNLPRFTLGVVSGFVEQTLNPDREYNNLKTDKWVRGCDQTSIMCKDQGELYFANDYHYYLILRRYLK